MEETLKTPPINYPEGLKIWETEIKGRDRLKVINANDFPVTSTLEGLGIQDSPLAPSFGISDRDEIVQRLGVMRWLIETPGVLQWLRNTELPSALPTEGQQFLEYADPKRRHNPYWQIIHDFLALVQKSGSLPHRLVELARFLEGSLPLEETERTLMAIVAEKLARVTVIGGYAELNAVIRKGSKGAPIEIGEHPTLHVRGVHGYQLYSFTVRPLFLPRRPRVTSNPFKKFAGVFADSFMDVANHIKIGLAKYGLSIRHSSQALEKDLQIGVLNLLKKIHWPIKPYHNVNVTLRCNFCYDERGLVITIWRIEPKGEREAIKFSYGSYEGYSFWQTRAIKSAEKSINHEMREVLEAEMAAKWRSTALAQDKTYFNEQKVSAFYLNKKYRWFALANVAQSAQLGEAVRVCQSHRNYLAPLFARLKQVAKLAEQMVDRSKNLGTPLYFPHVLTQDEHIVSFRDILPIHLLKDKPANQLVPIKSLADINSKMVCLTGVHTGGKTTTGLALLTNIYLAQSGLPVFGNDFRLNVKRMIGLVFIDRGKGSTVELLLEKIKNILLAIKDFPGGEVVLILDEVGTGTQQDAGFELGQLLLKKFAESGVSLLFSTQILALARYAQDELGALCYKVDEKHQISEGIAGGDLDKLMKRMGITKLLKR